MDFHLWVIFVFFSKAMTNDLPGVFQLTEPVEHGEGPTWDCKSEFLYFVSIPEGKVLRFDYFTNKLNFVQLPGIVSVVIPTKYDPHLLIIGLNKSVATLQWNGADGNKTVNVLTEVSHQFPTSILNDGKADNRGRMWIGTIGKEDASGVRPNEGILYRITKDNLKSPLEVLKPVTVSNGLAWNRDNDKFYYIDSPTLKVMEYDYNGADGSIANPRVAFDLSKYPQYGGVPDGMTMDRDNNLWIALYGGGGVLNVDPARGIVIRFITIPATYVTSVCWGGPALDVLFVTTSRRDLNGQQRLQQPGAGSLYAVKFLNTYGLPHFDADIQF